MVEKKYIRKTERVPRTITLIDLAPHLECYSLIGNDLILIEGKKHSFVCAFRKDGRVVCHCPQVEETGTCCHERALLNGLWAELRAVSKDESLIACTQAWCEPLSLASYLLPPVFSKQPVPMRLPRR